MITAALCAFLTLFALDFVWARYTQYVVAKRPWASGTAAALITALNGALTLLVVSDPWMILPAALGALTGTALAIKWH